MSNDEKNITICPNCGAEFDACGIIGLDRAEGTSQRSGNPSAELFNEPFQDPENQPEILSTQDLALRLASQGVVGDRDSIEFLLTKVNYRTVRKFCRAIEKRTAGNQLTIKNVQTLAYFDRSLQSVMLQGIGIVELKFRALLSRYLTDELGAFAHHHPENFKNADFYNSFLDDYARELKYKLKGRAIVNAEDFAEYGDVPIWQAVEILGLGTLSKLYRNIVSRDIRRGVADEFGVKFDTLASWLRTICEVRNRCAHFEDVCATPLTCLPKKIPGVTASNNGAFYACLVIEKLIEGNEVAVEGYIPNVHYTSYTDQLLSLVEKMPQPVFLAAGFPLNWMKQLKVASNLIKSINVTEYKESEIRSRTL